MTNYKRNYLDKRTRGNKGVYITWPKGAKSQRSRTTKLLGLQWNLSEASKHCHRTLAQVAKCELQVACCQLRRRAENGVSVSVAKGSCNLNGRKPQGKEGEHHDEECAGRTSFANNHHKFCSGNKLKLNEQTPRSEIFPRRIYSFCSSCSRRMQSEKRPKVRDFLLCVGYMKRSVTTLLLSCS